MVTTTTARFDKVEQLPTYRVLANTIASMIVSGRILPGEQLPAEMVLCEQFGVTRSTVREGIRLLEEMGMLRRRNQKRLIVSVPSEHHLSERTVQALLMRQVTVRKVYEAIKGVDPAIARAAAQNATKDHVLRLKDNIRRMEKEELSSAKLTVLDNQFHSLVCDAANNEILQIIRLPIQDLFMPMIAELVKTLDTKQRMLEAHIHIVDAIETRDLDRAERWARMHVEDFERGYLQTTLDFDAKVTREAL